MRRLRIGRTGGRERDRTCNSAVSAGAFFGQFDDCGVGMRGAGWYRYSMSLLNNLPPRHYGDAAAPSGDDGKLLSATKNEREYDAYIAWLADYLYVREIPLHPRQEAYASRVDAQDPGTALFEISDAFGYALWDLDSIENAFASEEDWPAFDAAQRGMYASLTDVEREDLTLEEWVLCRSAWLRLREEWTEKQACSAASTHADIPYRSLLSRILKRVPGREERFRLLCRYFENFSENASK